MNELVLDDLEAEVLPGGCAEPVIHVPGLVIVLILVPTPAF